MLNNTRASLSELRILVRATANERVAETEPDPTWDSHKYNDTEVSPSARLANRVEDLLRTIQPEEQKTL